MDNQNTCTCNIKKKKKGWWGIRTNKHFSMLLGKIKVLVNKKS